MMGACRWILCTGLWLVHAHCISNVCFTYLGTDLIAMYITSSQHGAACSVLYDKPSLALQSDQCVCAFLQAPSCWIQQPLQHHHSRNLQAMLLLAKARPTNRYKGACTDCGCLNCAAACMQPGASEESCHVGWATAQSLAA
ncbi:hypothetical protein COO60DRAFT_1498038 [Scenedesmus sp. NREL 46B-D3]|nr:hypothetical protein COO60DRAFT_1498038 [Scenedesmus sp. NREL 46B-D3]